MIVGAPKINKLAILIAGELRTWTDTVPYIFKFFNGQANQVDYFFVTWNVDGITGNLLPVKLDDIISPFNEYKQNLIAYSIENPIERRAITYYYQAWLALKANELKRKHEQSNNFVYDQVVETRPDLYLRKPMQKLLYPIPPMTAYNNYRPINEIQGIPITYRKLIDDVYIRSDSPTNDIISQRYFYSFPEENYGPKTINGEVVYDPNCTNHHCVYGNYLGEKNIEVTNKFQDYPFRIVTRPNFPFSNLDIINGQILWNEYYYKWGDAHLKVESNRTDPIIFC